VKSRDDRISGPNPLANSAARRIEAIIEGAEQAAERVIDEAEAKARGYLAEAEAKADRAVTERLASLGELTDALVAQADAIRRQAELLTSSLQEAKERLEAEGEEVRDGKARAVSTPDVPKPTPDVPKPTPEVLESTPEVPEPDEGEAPARAPHLAAVEPVEEAAAAEAAAPVEGRRGGTPAGARLLATQMAVSGSSRPEIAARLRSGFEIDDADAILDAILGPEG
jgi:hypothetical protein